MGSFRNTALSACLAVVLALVLSSCDSRQYVVIETPMGDMRVMLYDETPQHRDNFVKLVNEGYYDGLLFHRIIDGFMVQGGDPDSRGAAPGQPLGQGGPGYTIPAEIGAPHIKGALSAARLGGGGNPEKKSSGSQFYVVQGRPVPEAQLNSIEQQKNMKYNEAQRKLYSEIGGTPGLDGDYTVFGEVVSGLDVIDKLAAVATDRQDRPKEDLAMKVYMD
ncbi:MAG: peptidylprolyl isomerase [Saprospiraceae bacterium]